MVVYDEILTVRVRLRKKWIWKRGIKSTFIFDVDPHTPIRGGLEDYLNYLQNDIRLSTSNVNDLVDKYRKRARRHYGTFPVFLFREILRALQLLIKFGRGLVPFLPPIKTPFDISLKLPDGTARKTPCYLLYICETSNWKFRGDDLTGEVMSSPDPNIGNHLSFPNVGKQAKTEFFGVAVVDPGFPQNGANKEFKVNINMWVEQDPNRNTPVIIDPKIRNP